MTEPERLHADSSLATAPARPRPGRFESVLFAEGVEAGDAREPACFRDLNLDQFVDAVLLGRDEHELRPFFHVPLRDVDAVEYRHEVFRDLEDRELGAAVQEFCDGMHRVRVYLKLAREQRYRYEREWWFLEAAASYTAVVRALLAALAAADADSRALRALRRHLAGLTGSGAFRTMAGEARRARDALGRVRYAIRIRDARVTVTDFSDEPDYSVDIERVFARFKHGAPDSHLVHIPDTGGMDHVEARIVERVARLRPEPFAALDAFCARHAGFVDPTLDRFTREVQFYLAYRDHVERMESHGARFSYPEVTSDSKETFADAAFDAALATKLSESGASPVPNDFALSGDERVIVVTGPNQGGKTTFARTFGQLHYLAALGVPVPARRARLFLADGVYTHFEREEAIETLRGKLDDELVRMRTILEQTTEDSVVVVNEIFASTTLADAVALGAEVLGRLERLGCLVVAVTFLDELASTGPGTVSMVAEVAPDDPSRRTFRIRRRPPDGRAYAWAIAEKYGLSYERLRNRLAR